MIMSRTRIPEGAQVAGLGLPAGDVTLTLCVEAEKVLTGADIGPKIAKKCGITSMKGTAPLAKNGYKVRLFEGLIAKEILKVFIET
jgi:hypothetical protein